jgi:hypothetical protein
MVRRVGVAAAVVAVLGLVASMTFASASGEKRTSIREMLRAAAPSSVAGPDDDVDKRLVFVERNLRETFIDNPPEGDSQGDEFALSSVLMKNGKRVGRLDAHGVVTLAGERQFRTLINGTASVPGGEIENQGVASFTQTTGELEFGVTGGTGRYDDVGGELHIVEQSDRTKFVFDLEHLD